MEKFLLVFVFTVVCQFCLAENADKLFLRFSKEKNASTMEIDKDMLAYAGNIVGGEMKGVEAIRILDLSSCSSEVKKEFQKQVKKLSEKDYETLSDVTEKVDKSTIMVKIEDHLVKEVIVFDTIESFSFVIIKGNIDESEAQAYINK